MVLWDSSSARCGHLPSSWEHETVGGQQMPTLFGHWLHNGLSELVLLKLYVAERREVEPVEPLDGEVDGRLVALALDASWSMPPPSIEFVGQYDR